ncbi:Polygalacturonase [Hibiscus syriacus]|uniref:Polygalacturonase n=1 Tax=Hibiscus syriacus TaxID=106335 RepID=A0A6A3B4P5_HIBSY|nr:Polygalacturonase [Hibiscus syriacus]
MNGSAATQVVSLFVENIPRAFHWKGLWFIFARYGNVVGAYIANKLSRRGKRFGFVRFGSKVEVECGMEKLNGFVLNDFKLSVQFENSKGFSRVGGLRIANRETRRWGVPNQAEASKEAFQRILNQEQEPISNFQVKIKERGTLGRNEVSSMKRIKGFVEKEVLLKLKRCLVGKMSTVCSVREISFRLQKLGMNSIKVQRIGEIFSEVELWSESLENSERATWIKVSGIPLQCWNHITLKRLTELWGNFESLIENADHSINCENVTILITTNQDKMIDETVEIEIGNYIHLIRVLEIGISDDVGTLNQWGFKQKLNRGSNDHKEDFHLSSTEEDNSGASSAKVARSKEDPSCTNGNRESILRSKSGGETGCPIEVDAKRVEGSIGKVKASIEEHVENNREDVKYVEISALKNEDVVFNMGSSSDSPASNDALNHLRNLKEVADLKDRCLVAYKEAEKTLALGKSLGIQISGNETEAVKELALSFRAEMLLSHEFKNVTLDESDFCRFCVDISSQFSNLVLLEAQGYKISSYCGGILRNNKESGWVENLRLAIESDSQVARMWINILSARPWRRGMFDEIDKLRKQMPGVKLMFVPRLGNGFADHLVLAGKLCSSAVEQGVSSLGKFANEEPVEGIKVSKCTLTYTSNGVRIKTWAGEFPDTASDMHFEDITVKNAESNVKLSNISFKNIHGTAALPEVVKLVCSGIFPCENIELADIDITFRGPDGPAKSVSMQAQAVTLDVVAKFGVKADLNTDLSKVNEIIAHFNTLALLDAWKEACGSTTPTTILIPEGTYLLSQATLEGPCKAPIELQLEGNVKAPAAPKAFNEPKWNVRFDFLTNAMVQGITLRDSKQFHANVLGCKNITFEHVTVSAPKDSPNTDEIHIGRSDGVKIIDTDIKTGDDCISIGDGAKNLDITGVTCGPGHGIRIGSLGKFANEEPVEGIKVSKCTLTDTSNGVRIKTWAGEFPGTSSDMHFEDITVKNVSCPVLIDQKYCPWNKCKMDAESNVKLSNISFKNIHGTAALPEVVKLVCSGIFPCENVELVDIDITFSGPDGLAKSESMQAQAAALDLVAKFGAKANLNTDLSPCKAPIKLQLEGNVKAPADPKAFKVPKWVSFLHIENFKLFGGGAFDGQGTTSYKREGYEKHDFCSNLPINVRLDFLTNAMVQGITLRDSKQFHANVLGCKNITFEHVTVSAPKDSPNTDGIHIGRSDEVKIIDTDIKTGDDCISIGDGAKNLDITGVTCGPGHGIRIGSLGKFANEEPVEGIKVSKCTLTDTSNGVRIKTWAGEFPGTSSDMHFEDITVKNVSCPVLIDQKYCPWNKCKMDAESNVKLSNISFKNIHGMAALLEVVKLVCSGIFPCENLELADIDITFSGPDGPAKSKTMQAQAAALDLVAKFGAKANLNTDLSPCKAPIKLQLEGNVKAPADPKAFKVPKWVSFLHIENFKLFGGGAFDGQGTTSYKREGCEKHDFCSNLPINVRLDFLTNAMVQGITLRDSKQFHANVLGCKNITFEHVTVSAPKDSPNTDGIHIGRSDGVKIIDTDIKTGDDCISIGDGAKNLDITGVTCGPGHGISIGSLGKFANEEPVEGIKVSKCTLTDNSNGVRIKAWAGEFPSTASYMHFEDITVKNTESNVKLSNISFKNIHGTVALPEVVKLVCSGIFPCENVELVDIDITFSGPDGPAKSKYLSKPLLDAWKEACGSTTPTIILIPEGTYLLSQATLEGPCKAPTELQLEGNVKAPPDPKAFKEPKRVSFLHIENFKLFSGGAFDRQGTTSYKREDSPNTDGIHIGRSDGVKIIDTDIKIGDDCISIGDGAKNLDITGVTFGPGHGISICSLGKFANEESIEGIKVSKCTLTDTLNGVRIKTWAGEFPGTASDMHFEDITVKNVSCPVLIDQKYCPWNKCKMVDESNVKLSNISFKNIHGTVELPEVVKLVCSSIFPCENVELVDIDIAFSGPDGPAKSESMQAQAAALDVVAKFGAKADLNTNLSNPLLDAWKEACGSTTPTRIFIPEGTYLLSQATLEGPCKAPIELQLEGNVKVSDDPKAFNEPKWVSFLHIENFKLFGGGAFDRQGTTSYKKEGCEKHDFCSNLPIVRFDFLTNAMVQGITLRDSKQFHANILGCKNITFEHVTVSAPKDSPNTDGIHIGRSDRVKIIDTDIKIGDDCILIGDGAKNLDITGVTCGPGHGISIGSLGKFANEEPVERIKVSKCTLIDTSNGVRIKTWAGEFPGTASDMYFEDITVKNVSYPVLIDHKYCPWNKCKMDAEPNVKMLNQKLLENKIGLHVLPPYQQTLPLRDVLSKQLEGPCKAPIKLQLEGNVKAPADPKAFKVPKWVSFLHIENFKLFGGGAFDGQGTTSYKREGYEKHDFCSNLPINVRLDFLTNAMVQGITLRDSKQFHANVLGCKNITFEHVTVSAPKDSPNTDGIHIGRSDEVKIIDTDIKTGDDCISIGYGAKNLDITGVTCGPGHGISIGSLGKFANEEPVEGIKAESNVKLSNISFKNIHGMAALPEVVKLVCSGIFPCENLELADIDITFSGPDGPAKSKTMQAQAAALDLVAKFGAKANLNTDLSPCKAPIKLQLEGNVKAPADPKAFKNVRLDFLTNAMVQGITLRDSKQFHANVLGCKNITFEHVTVSAPKDSPNTDGIHIGRSDGVKIIDTDIKTGDDCISIGDGAKNLDITGVTCGPGHGISIGSLGKFANEEPVEGIKVSKCTLTDNSNGVRIKAWAGEFPSTASYMHFEDITVKNAESNVKLSNISFKNIHGTVALPEVVKLVCSGIFPCENVELVDIDITFSGPDGPAKSKYLSKPLLDAWKEACGSTTPTIILIPEGTYLLSQATLEGPCKAPTELQLEGNVKAPLILKLSRSLKGIKTWAGEFPGTASDMHLRISP